MISPVWAELVKQTAAAKYVIDWNVALLPAGWADAEIAAHEVLGLLLRPGEGHPRRTLFPHLTARFPHLTARKFGLFHLYGRASDRHREESSGPYTVYEYAAKKGLRLDQPPIAIEDLLSAVSEIKNLSVEIRKVRANSRFVAALLQIHEAGRVVLTYPEEQSPEVTRFAIAKELIHLLSESQAGTRPIDQQIEALVLNEEATEQEMYKNWAALEVLYPGPQRSQDLRLLNRGAISFNVLAQRYKIPEFLVRTAIDSFHFSLEPLAELQPSRAPQRAGVSHSISDIRRPKPVEDKTIRVSPDEPYRSELVSAAGGLYSTKEVASFLERPETEIRSLRRANKLLSVETEGAEWYPRAQFDETTKEVVQGIDSVVEGFAKQNPWITLEFLVTPDSVLGGISPLNALRQGGEMRARVERQIRINDGDGFA